MLCADWQALQKPVGVEADSDEPVDIEAGKFRWDGMFVANPALLGAWTTVTMVPSIEAFDPAKLAAHRAQLQEITIKDGGQTSASTMLWSGDTLLDLGRLEALKMTVKDDYLFIESGGFSARNPIGWKSPLVVLKKRPVG
jgi:hypothetical protein